jgi:putative DNA-invertase from lambdoid prophage Rac
MATFGYTRVSTTDQTTDNQWQELETSGYTIEAGRRFADIGVSGAIAAADRPQWALLITKLCAGDTVIVSKIDRLGRNAIDILQTVDSLSNINVKLVVLQFGGVDLTSSTGRMMLTMLGAMAEFERSLIVERTKAGIERARSEGKQLGAPGKDRAEAIALLQAGKGVSEVARLTGLSRTTLTKWRDEHTI